MDPNAVKVADAIPTLICANRVLLQHAGSNAIIYWDVPAKMAPHALTLRAVISPATDMADARPDVLAMPECVGHARISPVRTATVRIGPNASVIMANAKGIPISARIHSIR